MRAWTVTELSFKGKEFVYNHHLAVPFRPLVPDAAKGIGEARLDGNLIIHGDNLAALKSLLPMYAGKVDCIYIDPPYNTGNEGWCYNDNVNSPVIKEWLAANPIGIEDGLRHDKWCAMMWPRLRLLHELLAEDGSIWITLDDNEVHRARAMLDEIFGVENFLTNICWNSRKSKQNDAIFSISHNYIIGFSKNISVAKIGTMGINEAKFSNRDNDPRGPWTADPFDAPNVRTNLSYGIANPLTGETHYPPQGRHWRTTYEEFSRLLSEDRIVFGSNGRSRPQAKRYLSEALDKGIRPDTWWTDCGTATEATKELQEIFSGQSPFDTPKPTRLLSKILRLCSTDNSIILDSFAGSGTTAHAVLEANRRDGGNRRFILVEMEDYADTLTAERVRRVIKGYPFKGTQKTELLREPLSWRSLEKADKLLDKVQAIENLHGHEYDKISKKIKDAELIVTGEKTVDEWAEGLGGTFTYCTLGPAIELDKILTGETLPAYQALGAALFHMATNRAFTPEGMREADFYLGHVEGQHLWLLYKPDITWLKSPEAALTLSRAKAFAQMDSNAKHLVFAPSRFVSQKMLNEARIPVEFVPLPFALYRMERE